MKICGGVDWVRASCTGGCRLPSGRARRTTAVEADVWGALWCRYDLLVGRFLRSGFGEAPCWLMNRLTMWPRRAAPGPNQPTPPGARGCGLGGVAGTSSFAVNSQQRFCRDARRGDSFNLPNLSAGCGVAFPPAKGLGGVHVPSRIHPQHGPISKPLSAQPAEMQFQWHPGASNPSVSPIT